MVVRRIDEETFFRLFVSDQIAEDAEISNFELSCEHGSFSSRK
jgi:hypothetical protein